jgi:hypothetical protein
MIWVYLTEDIYAMNKKKVYGEQGERVVVVSNRHPAIIVCNAKGEKYTCHFSKLSNTIIQPKIKKNETTSKNGKRKAKR